MNRIFESLLLPTHCRIRHYVLTGKSLCAGASCAGQRWTSLRHPLPVRPGRLPGGLGVRVDSALYTGYRIPPYYDSLIGKLIVFGKTRTECMMRLKRAMGEFVIEGVETTIPLFQRLLTEPDIIYGHYDIHWLEHYLARDV